MDYDSVTIGELKTFNHSPREELAEARARFHTFQSKGGMEPHLAPIRTFSKMVEIGVSDESIPLITIYLCSQRYSPQFATSLSNPRLACEGIASVRLVHLYDLI